MIESASFSEMASRALQTWQMKLDCRVSSLIRCSSQNPVPGTGG